MVTLGISTWSIHRSLESGGVSLLDVPARLREHGLSDLQVCHFHLPSREPAWLERFRRSIEDAGVTLDAMLLDFGDLSHPIAAAADAAAMEEWLQTAAALGARYARVPAGSQPPTEQTLARSAVHLCRLADAGDRVGVRVITENWHDLLPDSASVLRLLDLTGGRVPLCLDFGNWRGPDKYTELQRIAPMAVTAHAKCSFSPTMEADAADYARCLALLKDAAFAGTIGLIYDGPSADEWRYLDEELAMVRTAFDGREG